MIENTISKAKTHKGETKILFKSPILEKLSRSHISFPVSFFILYSLGLLVYNIQNIDLKPTLTVSLFLAGVFVFTLVEYLLHRYVFHISAKTEKKKKFQYTIHGVHHDYPKDKTRLALPPLLSITSATT